MGNTDHVKSIAETIEQIHDGELYYCPHCGDMIHWDKINHNEEEDTDYCPECGEEVYQATMSDYFNDGSVYDIEYRVGSKHDDIKSVSVMVAFGGPNIYIDTGDKKVKLYWWGDYAECDISTGCADEITDFFNDIWNCE